MLRFLVLFGALALPALSALAQAPDYAGIAARCVPSLQEETVPREERRQQILAGIAETRFSYTLTQVPYETDLIAECYSDGRMTHRFLLASAVHWEKPQYGKGTLSLGWNEGKHELTVINDNGFGLWNRRVTLPPGTLDPPLAVVGAEKPRGEFRETVDDLGVKELTLYPVIGVVGASSDSKPPKTRFRLESTADFLAQAAADGARQCVVIYLFANHGGSVPFPFGGKTDFYEHSLPIN